MKLGLVLMFSSISIAFIYFNFNLSFQAASQHCVCSCFTLNSSSTCICLFSPLVAYLSHTVSTMGSFSTSWTTLPTTRKEKWISCGNSLHSVQKDGQAWHPQWMRLCIIISTAMLPCKLACHSCFLMFIQASINSSSLFLNTKGQNVM